MSSNILFNLKILRNQRGLSQEVIAKHLGIGKDAYRKIENGQSPMNVDRLISICNFLGVDVRDLLDDILDNKRSWEYQAELARLESGVHELKLERDRLWSLVNKLVKMLDPESNDEAMRLIFPVP